jgi:hypothetical protein
MSSGRSTPSKMPSTRSIEEILARGRWVRGVDDALEFVRGVGLCLIFADAKSSRRNRLPSLWDVVDAPDKQPGEKGFGERTGVVWRLKNDLPMTYPDEIFYGKLRGGRAMLCTMDHLRELHANQRQNPDALGRDAQRLLEIIRLRPITNGELRLDAGFHQPEARSRFERALQELQVSLQVARVDVDPDTWFLFDATYPRLFG